MLETTDVISRPGGNNPFSARIRNGYGIKVEREQEGYALIRSEGWNDAINRQYITVGIVGWVPTRVLTTSQVRHLYHLSCAADTRIPGSPKMRATASTASGRQ